MRFDRPLLRVTELRDGSTVRLRLQGELDLSTRPRVEDALAQAEESDPATIELDLGGLTFMDSCGVHLALEAQERALAMGHTLVVLPAPDRLQRIFRLTDTERLLCFRANGSGAPTAQLHPQDLLHDSSRR
jgi:anti-sigma B factor antagonist